MPTLTHPNLKPYTYKKQNLNPQTKIGANLKSLAVIQYCIL